MGYRHSKRHRVTSKLSSVAEANIRVSRKLVTYLVGAEKTEGTHQIHLPKLCSVVPELAGWTVRGEVAIVETADLGRDLLNDGKHMRREEHLVPC